VEGCQVIRVPRVVVVSVQGVGLALAFWVKERSTCPHNVTLLVAAHQCVPAPALWSV
jgi:hypothetical protein